MQIQLNSENIFFSSRRDKPWRVYQEPAKKSYLDGITMIKEAIESDEGEALGDTVMFSNTEMIITVLRASSLPADKRLECGIKLLHRFQETHERAMIVRDGVFAEYSRRQGLVLLEMKAVVNGIRKGSWENWANIYLDIPATTRQKYMRLASHKGSENFTFLGLERCLDIIAEMDKQKPSLRMADFLFQNGIYLTCFARTGDFSGLKAEVDTMLTMAKLRRNKIKADRAVVRRIINKGLKRSINAGCIKKLDEMKKNGQDPNTYLRSIERTNGAPPTNNPSEVKVMSFPHVSARMQDTVDAILADSDQLAEIAVDQVRDVIETLNQLVERRLSLENNQNTAQEAA